MRQVQVDDDLTVRRQKPLLANPDEAMLIPELGARHEQSFHSTLLTVALARASAMTFSTPFSVS